VFSWDLVICSSARVGIEDHAERVADDFENELIAIYPRKPRA
jgi:hypothetical protein